MNAAFGKDRRLLKRSEYNHVFEAPEKRSSDRYFTFLGHHRCGKARLGLAIAKRQVARAHERNRIKRLTREAFRCFTQKNGYDVVVMARREAQFADNDTLRRSLSRHLQKIWA